MKLPFSEAIKQLDGTPVREGAEPDSPVLTLGRLAAAALINDTIDSKRGASAAQKTADGGLAIRIMEQGDNAELNVDEATRVRTLIGEGAGTLLVCRAYALIDAVMNPAQAKES